VAAAIELVSEHAAVELVSEHAATFRCIYGSKDPQLCLTLKRGRDETSRDAVLKRRNNYTKRLPPFAFQEKHG
jgi:hypothetical protein